MFERDVSFLLNPTYFIYTCKQALAKHSQGHDFKLRSFLLLQLDSLCLFLFWGFLSFLFYILKSFKGRYSDALTVQLAANAWLDSIPSPIIQTLFQPVLELSYVVKETSPQPFLMTLECHSLGLNLATPRPGGGTVLIELLGLVQQILFIGKVEFNKHLITSIFKFKVCVLSAALVYL